MVVKFLNNDGKKKINENMSEVNREYQAIKRRNIKDRESKGSSKWNW